MGNKSVQSPTALTSRRLTVSGLCFSCSLPAAGKKITSVVACIWMQVDQKNCSWIFGVTNMLRHQLTCLLPICACFKCFKMVAVAVCCDKPCCFRSSSAQNSKIPGMQKSARTTCAWPWSATLPSAESDKHLGDDTTLGVPRWREMRSAATWRGGPGDGGDSEAKETAKRLVPGCHVAWKVGYGWIWI